MANFIIVVDPDPERRSHFTRTIEPLLPPVEGLITNSCATGNFHASWAANPHAPISYATEQDGAAVIWGEAIVQSESLRIDASRLKALGRESEYKSFPPFDGFYAAVVYHPQFGITVGADILGIFPVYYYTNNDVILVGSSPELFRYHPLFKTELNPAGLVGILLTNGLFEGQTLWQNVRRLGAGNLLVWHSQTNFHEVRQNHIPELSQQTQNSELTFSEHLDILDQILDKAIARHAPEGQPYSLLLSGGLDSRMLAGYLQRRGIKPIALTLGKRTDLEMECAIPVVRTLGLKHYTAQIPFEEYPKDADILVKWEHLANGSNCIMDWGVQSHLRKLPPKVVSGFLLDRVVGGLSTYDPVESLSFESFFTRSVNQMGHSPQLLKRLLRKEVFGDLVQETCDRIRTVYESYSDVEFRRTWWFDLFHRQRFHVGCAGWQLCFGAWPVLPILDWQVLQTTAALPVEVIAKRRAQNELLSSRFWQLATLPLDRNDFYIDPLKFSQSGQRLARLYRLQGRWRKIQRKLGIERRYYYRMYDLNNKGWKAVRRQAEPNRERVQHLFHPDVLNELLPSPELPVPLGSDPIPQSSGIKLLIGLLLWSKEHL